MRRATKIYFYGWEYFFEREESIIKLFDRQQ